VLLHVIETAWPIDSSSHDRIASRRNTLDHVKHALLAVVDAFHYTRAVERSGITRLSAARGIERSAIENDRSPSTHAIGHVNHASFKLD
jgi:hypothetical protein